MKYLIFVFAVIFAISIFNQEVYPQKKRHQNPEGFRMNMKDKLNLTDEQLSKIESLKLSHQETVIKMKAELDLKKVELRKIKSSENLSRSEIIKITKEINAIKNDMALAMVNHQMDVYENLDENQRKLWSDKQDQIECMKNNFRDKMRDRRN